MNPKVSLRVVAVSPSDVEAEVATLERVIGDVNRNLALAGRNMVLELANWKTDVYPGFHLEGTQAWIDSILKPEQADLVVGVFWKRLGSTGAAGTSGTEHEIRLACESASKVGKPHVMLYFNQTAATPKSKEEADEWGKVLALKKALSSTVFYSEYIPAQFTYQVQNDLFRYVIDAYPAPIVPEISVTALPALVRAEGLAEVVGEIQLRFTGYKPGTYDVRLFLNSAITNRVSAANLTDAELSTHSGDFIVRGELISTGALLFARVPLDASPCNLRIGNIRANANALSIGFFMPVPHVKIPAFPILGTLSIQPCTEAPPSEIVPVGPAVVLAHMKPGLAFRAWGPNYGPLPVTISRSVDLNTQLLGHSSASGVSMTLYLQFCELIPNSFKTAAEEGAGADSGTKLWVKFHLPYIEGAQIFVTSRSMSLPGTSGPKAVLAQPLSALPAAGEVEGTPVVRLPFDRYMVENDSATAVWEWIDEEGQSPNSLDEVVFGVVVAATAIGRGIGGIMVGAAMGPTAKNYEASPDAPIPRFVDMSRSIQAIQIVR